MPDPADDLRLLIRQAGADLDAAPAVARLEALLEAALAHAELRGIHLLARTIPHELAQPLTEVRGYADLLAEGAVPADEQAEVLAWLAQAAARAGALVHAVGRLAHTNTAPPRRTIGGQELLVLPRPMSPRGAD